jgi:transcriptional regulator with XRE-family HTH domain
MRSCANAQSTGFSLRGFAAGKNDREVRPAQSRMIKRGAQMSEGFYKESLHNKAFFSRTENLREFYDELIEDMRLSTKTETDFGKMAAELIKHKGYNRKVFSEKTRLSKKTYDRIVHDNIPAPSLRTVMAICIGLNLNLEQSECLLEKAGYKLNTSFQHTTYHRLLASHIWRSIEECDELLVALALPPISSRPRSQKTLPEK